MTELTKEKLREQFEKETGYIRVFNPQKNVVRCYDNHGILVHELGYQEALIEWQSNLLIKLYGQILSEEEIESFESLPTELQIDSSDRPLIYRNGMTHVNDRFKKVFDEK